MTIAEELLAGKERMGLAKAASTSAAGEGQEEKPTGEPPPPPPLGKDMQAPGFPPASLKCVGPLARHDTQGFSTTPSGGCGPMRPCWRPACWGSSTRRAPTVGIGVGARGWPPLPFCSPLDVPPINVYGTTSTFRRRHRRDGRVRRHHAGVQKDPAADPREQEKAGTCLQGWADSGLPGSSNWKFPPPCRINFQNWKIFQLDRPTYRQP